MKTLVVAAVLLTFLGGCVPPDPLDRLEATPPTEGAKIAHSANLMRTRLSGNTIWNMSDPKDGGHGTQVEYHAPDGRSFLWYPGNSKIVPGRWEVRQGPSGGVELCYKYPTNSYNPIMYEPGGQWNCRTPHWLYLGDALRGDPFHLSKGVIPFVISDRDYHAPRRLMQMAGGDPASIDFITTIAELEP